MLLPFEFLLSFPADLISQRTVALCISEIMEETENQESALFSIFDLTTRPEENHDSLLNVLIRMSSSPDPLTRQLAVKALSLLCNCSKNAPLLLKTGGLEIFYNFIQPKELFSHESTDCARAAWQGMIPPSRDIAGFFAYGLGLSTAGIEPKQPDECRLLNRGPHYRCARIALRVIKACSFYFKVTVNACAKVVIGILSGGWRTRMELK